MKIVQVVHTKERRKKNKNKQKNKQTNKQTNTNLRHTQCVNNEIHIYVCMLSVDSELRICSMYSFVCCILSFISCCCLRGK